MNIGFINFFPFRPFVKNSVYISEQMKSLGHEVFFLVCDGSPKICHNKLINRSEPSFITCAKCKLGGVGTFDLDVENITNYNLKSKLSISDTEIWEWLQSTRATAYRLETKEELSSQSKENINDHINSVRTIFYSVANWLESKKIDALICFNGRMDFTKAAIKAAEKVKVPFLTHDSTWFGNGLTISPNSEVISLKKWHILNEKFRDLPLKANQLEISLQIISRRLNKTSVLEWKQFNINAIKANWPESSNPSSELRILVVPSSRSEFVGSNDYNSEWSDDIKVGFEKVIKNIELNSSKNISCVVKGHPIWNQTLFGSYGTSAISYYSKWCKEKGYFWVDPKNEIDTTFLIQQCDILLVAGSSAAIEAVFYKKPIICISNNVYQKAGFTCDITNSNSLNEVYPFLQNFNPTEAIQKALRFIYTASNRMPTLLNGIISQDITKNSYFESIKEIQYLLNSFESDNIIPSDDSFADTDSFEILAIEEFIKNQYFFQKTNYQKSSRSEIKISRKFGFNWIDTVRNKFVKGDEK